MKKLFLTQRSISFSRLLSAVFLLLASVARNTVAAQCSPDVEPPIMACAPVVGISTNQHGPNMTLLQAALLNDGTYDNCTANLTYRIGTDLSATTPPNTTQVPIYGIGETFARLWAGDAAGNWNSCTVLIESGPAKCNPDVLEPTCTPPPNLTISLANYEAIGLDLNDNIQMNAAFGAPAVWDNCSDDNVIVAHSYQLEINTNNQHSKITRSFMALDEAFNTSVVSQVITIDGNSAQIHVPGWFYPGDATEDNVVVQSDNNVMMAHAYSDQVFNATCNGEKVRVLRTHTVIDWLFPSEPGDPALELPVVDLDGDGQTGDAYDVIFSNDSVWMVYNGQTLSNLGPKTGLYTYLQEFRYNYLDTSEQSVKGFVYRDVNLNGLLDASEPTLANWKVKVTGSSEVYTGYTNAAGAYEIFICPGDTQLEVSLDVPFNFYPAGSTSYAVNLPAGAVFSQNIPVMLVDTCPLLTTELATQRIRPCFPGKYSVSYCNLSDQTIPGAHVVVKLDSLLQFTSATLTHTSLGNQMYDFVLDTLFLGECGLFDVYFSTNCNAPVGLTHCSEARIFPDTVCGNANWSGAIIAAKGYCEGDKVRLLVENIGLGSMSNELNFVVVEDLIMYSTNPFTLDPGETKEVIMPANGSTWRIETPQESGYPWHGKVAAFVEGCGGLNQTGMPLVFSVATPSPFVATDCTESVSSYDPNDKQAVPRGLGTEHLIEANTDIQYTIRFQNTGTDTAYTVVLLDTLSPLLNPRSITRSTASHAYDLDVLPGNVLRVRFDNIKLPHQAINEAGSQGFVKFNVSQTPDNALGSVVKNRAAIYFDINAPVITNTTIHTIGKDFMLVSTTEPSADAIKVFPNPATSEATLVLPVSVQGAHFTLTDALGKVARTIAFSGNTYRFERQALSSGVYYFTIRATDGTLYSGRIVLR